MNAGRRLVSGPAGAVAAVAAVLLIGAGLFWVRWSQPTRQAMPDTYWYTRQAVMYSGASTARAGSLASRIECASRNRYAREIGMRQACHHYPTTWPDPRYIRIFTTRPGFSLLAAPLVLMAGAWRGMEWATALGSVLAAVLGYAAVRALRGSRVAGLAAAVLLFALPAGYWITRILPEGAMLAGCLATGIGVTLPWPHPAGPGADGASADGPGEARPGRGWVAAGILLAAAGLLWTYVIKSANGFLLTISLLAGGAVIAAWTWARRPTLRNPGLIMAVLGLAGAVGWVVASKAAHLPSFTDTIQDMASSHFKGRLAPDPVGYLAKKETWFVPHWGLKLVRDPWPLVVVAAGIAGLAWTCRERAVPWLLIGATGPLAVAAHPIGSEADRLVLPVWLPVIAGLALAGDRAGRRVIGRLITRQPETGSPGTGSPGTARPDAGSPETGRPGTGSPGTASPGTQATGLTVAFRSPARGAADNVTSPPARP